MTRKCEINDFFTKFVEYTKLQVFGYKKDWSFFHFKISMVYGFFGSRRI